MSDAQMFVEQLAERASASAVLDEPWWMALQEMLDDGWTITPPENDTAPIDAAPIPGQLKIEEAAA